MWREVLRVDLPELRFVMKYEGAISSERLKLESRIDVELIWQIHRYHSL